MQTRTKVLAVLLGSCLLTVLASGAALAQSVIEAGVEPEENRSPLGPLVGPISFAVIFMGGALLFAIMITLLYMRYAPRFARDEEAVKVVMADRVLPGREAPRRTVDLSQATPVVVQPPAAPALAAVAAPAAPAQAPASPAAAPAEAPAGPAETAPTQPAVPVAPAAPAAPAETAPTQPATPAAPAAPAAPAETATQPAAPAPAAAPEERVEVTMDQEVFEATLAELLEQGTDRRIAEGKARRAGMIAAKKKAAGGA